MKKINFKVKEYLGKAGGGTMRDADVYKVLIGYDGKQMTVPFYMGSALEREPEKDEVLHALVTDALCVSAFPDLPSFMDEFGYKDYRQGEKTFRTCQKNSERLSRMFGEDLPELIKRYEDY